MNNRVLLTAAILASMSLIPISVIGADTAIAQQQVQQQQEITGTVIDDTGEPVIGATVIVDGGDATQGTITDFD